MVLLSLAGVRLSMLWGVNLAFASNLNDTSCHHVT